MSAPGVAWTPTPEVVERANVTRFMRQHGIGSYKRLVERSQHELEWFWGAVADFLEIEWFTPYTRVLDESRGPAWAQWFVGGQLNLAHNCVDKHARSRRRNKVALLWEGEDGAVAKWTYWDLWVETNRLGNALKELGVRLGDRVGIYMPMLPETVVALLGCAKIGAIGVPVFSGYGAEAVRSRLCDSEARVLLTADGFRRRGKMYALKTVADAAVADAPTVRAVVVRRHLGDGAELEPRRDYWWDEFVGRQSRDCVSLPVDSETPFMLAYTSGTTGRPKGAVHVHAGFLVKIAEEVAFQVDLQDEDVLWWLTDMGWIMGPWAAVGGLALGGTILLYDGAPDHPAPDRLWTIVARHGVSILGISPTLIRALMRHGPDWVHRHDLHTLRILGSTGEPWNPEPWRWCFEHVGQGRCPIINFSGGTEVGACFLSPLPITSLKPTSLVGPALGVAVDVFDEQGNPVRDSVGELVATRPWPGMTRGLWRDPQRYLDTYWSRWPNVWVHGDWASVDRDGFWFLHGRSDDTIKVAGKRVGPAEVESALISHPAVLEAAAIGIPHPEKGEGLVCFAVLRPAATPSPSLAETLRGHVASQLGAALRPEAVYFVRELPKTRNAKIMRRLIRAKALGERELGDLSSLENPEALDEIAPIVHVAR